MNATIIAELYVQHLCAFFLVSACFGLNTHEDTCAFVVITLLPLLLLLFLLLLLLLLLLFLLLLTGL